MTLRASPAQAAEQFNVLQSPAHGVWAITQDTATAAAGQAGRVLLQCIDQQVGSGEDLTAAFLAGHGHIHRAMSTAENPSGAAGIAVRHSPGSSNFELAWVGPMHGFLVRKRQVLRLSKEVAVPSDLSRSKAQGFILASDPVDALGLDGRIRPTINRKLGHALRGDMLALVAGEVDPDSLMPMLSEGAKGIWSLEYKARKIQGLIERQANASGALQLMLCMVK